MTTRHRLWQCLSWTLFVLAAGALTAAFLPRGAVAANEQVLYNFCSRPGCEDGGYPQAGVIMDGAGNFYGTTVVGGDNNSGTVYQLSPGGTETVLYSFCPLGLCLGGANPVGGLVMDRSGNLLGTQYSAGTLTNNGVVFQLTPVGISLSWVYSLIHEFCPPLNCNNDGINPQASLIIDGSGNLYGTTVNGGTGGGGTVFKLTPGLLGYTETILYNFCSQSGCTDGLDPQAGLVFDNAGNLYGTTYGGGAAGAGTVFKLTPGGAETVLYSFCPSGTCTDGFGPLGGLITDGAGNLYGTTAFSNTPDGHFGWGVVFKLAPNGTETVLYTLCSQPACADGAVPAAGLIMDTAGNLYGTTAAGGNTTSTPCTDPALPVPGCGVVFKLTPDATGTVWTQSVPYTFCSQTNCVDGRFPLAGLIQDGAGNVYGTTAQGGNVDSGAVFTLAAPVMTAGGGRR